MSKWTRANPLMSVPGYNVPRGHFANGYTNGGDRVGFKRGGSAQQKLIKGKQERAAKENVNKHCLFYKFDCFEIELEEEDT